MKFIDVLYGEIKKKEITANKFCADLGLSSATVTMWASRNSIPNGDTLNKIADYFGVTTDYLLGRTPNKTDGLYSFEVLGSIKAGFDGNAIEDKTGETVTLPRDFIHGNKDDYCVVEVKGSSMYPVLVNGDKILVRRQQDIANGDIAVIIYNGNEATVKTVRYGIGYLDLIPKNPEYETRHITGADLEQCHIVGRVEKLIRDL